MLRAGLVALGLALLGMVGCSAPSPLTVPPASQLGDEVWVALSGGDLASADRAAQQILDPDLSSRACWDVLAHREGRAAALVACLDQQTWLAARFLASDRAAEDELRRAEIAGVGGATRTLEQARRAESASERIAFARSAQLDDVAAAEGLAIEVETLLGQGRWKDAARLLPDEPPTARLALMQRRLDHATRRYVSVVNGVCDDLQRGRAVPYSVALLEDALRLQPSIAGERQAAQALRASPLAGAALQRSRERLLALLEARSGDLAAAVARLDAIDPRQPEEDEVLRRWKQRLAPGEAVTLEERLDGDPQRLAHRDLFLRRLGDEWDLEARGTYHDAGEGRGVDLDEFLARLDTAAASLPERPELKALPRQDYGLFGTLLDTGPLHAVLPDAVLLGGQGPFMPPEMTWFDCVGCETVALAAPLGEYEQCTVRRTRVPGLRAYQGASITGAGLDRLVWLDLDELEREERSTRPPPRAVTVAARPATLRAERLSLSEPLDVEERLTRLSREAAGEEYPARVLETIALHEGQHIIDFQEFVAQGGAGRVWTLLGAGLLPGPVRAEIERRAQLRALREASDPRIALAQAVSRLPLEGAALDDEHAVAYAGLVAELVECLDRPRLPDGRPPEALGLDRQRVLLQQLDRVPPEVLRALAQQLDD